MMMGRAGTGSLPGACFPWSELHFHLCFWPAFIFFPRPLQIFSFSVLELWVVLFCWNPFLFPCKTLVFSSSSFHPLEACWVLMSTDCALLFSFVVCHLQPKAVRHNLGYIFIHLSLHPSFHPFTHPFIHSICSSSYWSIYPSLHHPLLHPPTCFIHHIFFHSLVHSSTP